MHRIECGYPIAMPRIPRPLALVSSLICTFTLCLAVWAQDMPSPANQGAGAVVADEVGTPPGPEVPATQPVKELAPADPAAMPKVGYLELSGPLREGPIPYAWITPAEAEPSLRDVVKQLNYVAQSPEHTGLVIWLDVPELSAAQLFTLADAIGRVKAAGKTVASFSETYDLKGYLLASAGDLILLQRKGSVELSGLAVEEMYLTGLMEKVGVKADLLQVGKFKGADEPLTRTEPSEAWDQNIDALLDDVYAQLIGRIALQRNMKAEEVEAVIRDSWTLGDDQLLERKIVDRLVSRDLLDVTREEYGDVFEYDEEMGRAAGKGGTPDNPFALFAMLMKEPQVRAKRDSIAVVYAEGPIMSGESSLGDGLFSSASIGSQTLVDVMSEAQNDPLIKGVVLRIDSPGGSALASEVIWQSMRSVGEHKPVYVVVGPMAASGGYYMACAADRVYVSPQSIVGSIGVVGGKMVLGDLYEKLGIGITRRTRGPMADMFNSVEPFTQDQRVKVRAAMERVYDQFTDRVKIGRGEHIADIDAIAQGRLFTGRQAVKNGMADELGGVDAAIGAMAGKLNLREGQYDVLDLPEPVSLQDYFSSMFGVSAPASVRGSARGLAAASSQGGDVAAMLLAARRLMGPASYQAMSRQITGLLLLQDEPVLMLMPAAIVID